MKKLLIKLTITIAVALIAIAQLNYEQAVEKASKVDTDGEIQSVLDDHGFQVGIYDDVSMYEKLSAVVITLTSNEAI